MVKIITLIVFIYVVLMELNYFGLRKWRIKNHRKFSSYTTTVIICISLFTLFLNIIY